MSHWIFSCRPSTSSEFHISSDTVHHLEYLFQDFKPYLLELDVKTSTCSYQFNRRVSRAEIENRLNVNKIHHIAVQGVYNPPLVYHPNSNVLINEENSSTNEVLNLSAAKDWGASSRTQNRAVSAPPSPPRAVKLPEETAPILTVIKIRWTARLPIKDPNTQSLHILAPFEFYVPSKSFTHVELGFALMVPEMYSLKLDNRVSNEHIILKQICVTPSFHEPLSLTFINTHPTDAIRIPVESLIAAVTCHKIPQSKVLVVNSNIFNSPHPITTTPISTKLHLDDEPPRKKTPSLE